MDKPTKPSNLMPRSFGGVKNNFSASLQSSGYEDGVPAIYGGDNLNYQLDATGKELDYCETICDFINNIPIGKTVTVDANNKLVYDDLAQEPSIATTETVGVVKPDGETITITQDGTISSAGANKNLSNLTTFGNARLQYSPFAINAGTVSNGKNATLFLPGGSQTTQEVGFFQPIMTANGTTGGSVFAVFASSEEASFSNYAYKAFDGDTGYGSSNVWEATGSSPQYIGWYNPNPMKMDSLTIRNGFSDHFVYVVTAGEIQYSNDGTNWTTEQTFTNSVTSNGAYWTINIASPVLSNYKRIYITSATNKPMIANIQFNNATELVTITASTTVICDPCTITTCDSRTLEDEDSSLFEVTNETDGDYFIFKNYTNKSLSLASSLTITNNLVLEQTWTQPTLSANGTLGGDSFAVYANSEGTNLAWKAFDNNSSTNWGGAMDFIPSVANPQYLIFYSPTPIKVSNLSIKQYTDNYGSIQGFVEASNDNSNWVQVASWSKTSPVSPMSVACSTDGFYKYYKVATTGNYNNSKPWAVYEVTITATEQTTPSDGTYWLDTSVTPANLKIYDTSDWITNNNLVWIGNCSISSGAITDVENRAFNDSGFVLDKFLVEDYKNGASWYRVYQSNNGKLRCVQGGYVTSANNKSVQFLKPFIDIDYGFSIGGFMSGGSTYAVNVKSRDENGMTFAAAQSGYDASWVAYGYIS